MCGAWGPRFTSCSQVRRRGCNIACRVFILIVSVRASAGEPVWPERTPPSTVTAGVVKLLPCTCKHSGGSPRPQPVPAGVESAAVAPVLASPPPVPTMVR